MYGTEWPILCWCAVKKLLTHSLNLTFYPYGVGKSSTNLSGCGWGGVCSAVWSVIFDLVLKSKLKFDTNSVHIQQTNVTLTLYFNTV